MVTEHVIFETRRNQSKQSGRFVEHLERFLSGNVTIVEDPTEQTVRDVSHLIVVKDVPIVAGAIDSGSLFIATYDRKHLIDFSAAIELRWGIKAVTPIEILTMFSSRERTIN